MCEVLIHEGPRAACGSFISLEKDAKWQYTFIMNDFIQSEWK